MNATQRTARYKAKRVLGIDLGIANTGGAVVCQSPRGYALLSDGIIRTTAGVMGIAQLIGGQAGCDQTPSDASHCHIVSMTALVSIIADCTFSV